MPKRGRHRSPLNKYDVAIGDRIRQKRMLKGMSQTKLGDLIERSYQQVQKYESGVNRVSGELLLKLANALDEPVAYFTGEAPSPAFPHDLDLPRMRETGQMARAFASIHRPELRRAIRNLVNKIAKVPDDEDT